MANTPVISNEDLINELLDGNAQNIKYFKTCLDLDWLLKDQIGRLQSTINERTKKEGATAFDLYLKATLSYYFNKLEEAKTYYNLASLQNCPFAANDSALRYLDEGAPESVDTSPISLLHVAYKKGNIEAYNNLAAAYYFGIKFSQDKAQAIQILDEAIQKNDADAMYHRGLIHLDVLEVHKAKVLFEKALDLGCKEAAWMLAELNHNNALEYLDKALESGRTNRCKGTDSLDDKMKGSTIDAVISNLAHDIHVTHPKIAYCKVIKDQWQMIESKAEGIRKAKIKEKVDTLIKHGQSIKKSDAHKGDAIVNLGEALKKIIETNQLNTVKTSGQSEIREKIAEYESSINKHRNLLKPIVLNVLLLSTVVGIVPCFLNFFLGLALELLKDSTVSGNRPIDWNRCFFFGTTHSQDLCDEIINESEHSLF